MLVPYGLTVCIFNVHVSLARQDKNGFPVTIFRRSSVSLISNGMAGRKS